MDMSFTQLVLTHPFQVALLVLTFGAVVREVLRAVVAEPKLGDIPKLTLAFTDPR